MTENNLLSRKQIKIIPQKKKNFFKNTVAQGFRKIK